MLTAFELEALCLFLQEALTRGAVPVFVLSHLSSLPDDGPICHALACLLKYH